MYFSMENPVGSVQHVSHTPRPGVSMPAVTAKLVSTKHDMRNGRKTGSPVSFASVSLLLSGGRVARATVPG